jgi:hypothetical protein
MKILGILVAAALLLAGCGAPAAPAKNDSVMVKNDTVMENKTEEPAPPPSTGTPPTNPQPANTSAKPPAPSGTATQQECATMTPNCGACIAKAGCGWCKTSSGCYVGNVDGPAVVDCQPGDWAVTEEECKAPSSPVGSTCAEQYNCAHCLSGSGCKWCIEGSKCVDASSADACSSGLGWLTQSYQCNLASR